ncbi:MAG: outer membrane protein transport protein [Verrucomicrobia bacterium]|nr:outer membrane protein transport protein [Kiritimatiellia bacterium]MCP5487103.1 outer membrane protein transport protein [Verrucomicrobiota bacterium]
MQKRKLAAIAFAGLLASQSWATNGDNLIGIGPVDRALGGTGIAAPQDSLTAIFGNPAGMSFCPCGEGSEAIFAGSIFAPTVNARIGTPMGTYSGESQHDPFLIPAMGVTMPVNESMRFGVGAYGISGLGVDYRNMGWDLDGNPANGFEGDLYSRLEVMKFAPMLAYKVNDTLSVGGSLQASYNNLDLGSGGSHTYAYGVQLGILYVAGSFHFGASYTSPEKADFENVFNFDSFTGDTQLDDLTLEAPATYAAGVAYTINEALMVEVDAKFLNWADAEGYKDFDWDDQWVIGLGIQYKASEKWVLRAGYNYAENPVKEHDGFDPMGVSSIQGTAVPTLGYELFRVVGFPAVVESHLTLGAGYQVTEDFSISLAYVHAFENTISQSSAGDIFKLESDLSEDIYTLGMAWAF